MIVLITRFKSSVKEIYTNYHILSFQNFDSVNRPKIFDILWSQLNDNVDYYTNTANPLASFEILHIFSASADRLRQLINNVENCLHWTLERFFKVANSDTNHDGFGRKLYLHWTPSFQIFSSKYFRHLTTTLDPHVLDILFKYSSDTNLHGRKLIVEYYQHSHRTPSFEVSSSSTSVFRNKLRTPHLSFFQVARTQIMTT
jgi:hypothetical protein